MTESDILALARELTSNHVQSVKIESTVPEDGKFRTATITYVVSVMPGAPLPEKEYTYEQLKTAQNNGYEVGVSDTEARLKKVDAAIEQTVKQVRIVSGDPVFGQ